MKTQMDDIIIRARNTLTIESVYDLKQLFSEPICLSGNIQEEIEQNAWHIWAYDENCEKKITIQDLENFFNKLIQVKEEQIGNRQATLYVWVEGKFRELCFNIVSGITTNFPFHHAFEEVPLTKLICEYINLLQEGPESTFFGIRNENIDDDDYGCYEFGENEKIKVFIKFFNEDKK